MYPCLRASQTLAIVETKLAVDIMSPCPDHDCIRSFSRKSCRLWPWHAQRPRPPLLLHLPHGHLPRWLPPLQVRVVGFTIQLSSRRICVLPGNTSWMNVGPRQKRMTHALAASLFSVQVFFLFLVNIAPPLSQPTALCQVELVLF